mgnify:CR=1 FL=1
MHVHVFCNVAISLDLDLDLRKVTSSNKNVRQNYIVDLPIFEISFLWSRPTTIVNGNVFIQKYVD